MDNIFQVEYPDLQLDAEHQEDAKTSIIVAPIHRDAVKTKSRGGGGHDILMQFDCDRDIAKASEIDML